MKLRSILRVLSLLAIVFAFTAGSIYYSTLRQYAFEEAERRAVSRVQTTRKNLSSFLSEFKKPVRVLAGMAPLKNVLVNPGHQTFFEANYLLDHFKKTLGVDVCYLMNVQGDTIASSNRDEPDSFVGQNFSFRPYFQQAMQGLPSTYLALGTTSRKRGAYYSYPVYLPDNDIPLGIVVIKASIFFIEKELTPKSDGIELVVDPKGVIFISNRQEWLYNLLWSLSDKDMETLKSSRQFGQGPWNWVGIKKKNDTYAVDASGKTYLFHQQKVDNYPDWKIIHLYKMEAVSKAIANPLIQIIRPVLILLFLLIGVSVFFLYRKAATEILQRKSVEKALRKSEERYRSLYHNTPAMLHSIDKDGNIVSISNYWSEILGYTRKEAIGKKLTYFLSEESRTYAKHKVFPEFFKAGFLKDVHYTFVKKNREKIDVLLSAITDDDIHESSFRSLAVSIDVTKRKKAEEELRLAKEALSVYSKDLERQVRKRTGEITSILKYTPAVVYIKDGQGKYILVNSKFEQIFNVHSDDVRGKTDHDILSGEIADQFKKNDGKVLIEKIPFQVEERIRLEDGIHTYLSIKFPFYDSKENVRGVCGIATDITELKNAQDNLRRLSRNIMAGQEKERAYLARELHDELGQVLTALRMESAWLKERFKKTDIKASDRALTMCNLIDKTIDEVRGIAIRLRPGVLDHLGLVDAIDWYASDFERRYGITCIFEHEKVPEIRGLVATAAYRIAQEALTNVARHASASRVTVSMQMDMGLLNLTVKDDGAGFDPKTVSDSHCLGMVGMKERAFLVGGSLEVESSTNKGTFIKFAVPGP